ncbi:hypothetical protein BDZ90DRAFT_271649 [Jaminaea rosea]|uniref:Myb-like domain-containing protein n=1 Tax=Jaminaea rosea TaxID=1569628 RepID=A0A316US25_9BASI|nr:hypothetical protein BDZ90DRAFT_271649 [Jaminaea rosea]PWN27784.1 hypothetical protein BDZ90DRAFT_271649 [Jaminaea rosea]
MPLQRPQGGHEEHYEQNDAGSPWTSPLTKASGIIAIANAAASNSPPCNASQQSRESSTELTSDDASPPVPTKWTGQESELLLKAVARYGLGWPKVARKLAEQAAVSRSAGAARHRYERLLDNGQIPVSIQRGSALASKSSLHGCRKDSTAQSMRDHRPRTTGSSAPSKAADRGRFWSEREQDELCNIAMRRERMGFRPSHAVYAEFRRAFRGTKKTKEEVMKKYKEFCVKGDDSSSEEDEESSGEESNSDEEGTGAGEEDDDDRGTTDNSTRRSSGALSAEGNGRSLTRVANQCKHQASTSSSNSWSRVPLPPPHSNITLPSPRPPSLARLDSIAPSVHYTIHHTSNGVTLTSCPPGLGIAIYSPWSISFMSTEQLSRLTQPSAAQHEQPAFAFKIEDDRFAAWSQCRALGAAKHSQKRTQHDPRNKHKTSTASNALAFPEHKYGLGDLESQSATKASRTFSVKSEPTTKTTTMPTASNGPQEWALLHTSAGGALASSSCLPSTPTGAAASTIPSPRAILKGDGSPPLLASRARVTQSHEATPVRQLSPLFSTPPLSTREASPGFEEVEVRLASVPSQALSVQASNDRSRNDAREANHPDSSASRSIEPRDLDDSSAHSVASSQDSESLTSLSDLAKSDEDNEDDEDEDERENESDGDASDDNGSAPSYPWPGFDWTRRQDEALLRSVQKHGTKWTAVQEDMAAAGAPRRTRNALSIRYTRIRSKRQRDIPEDDEHDSSIEPQKSAGSSTQGDRSAQTGAPGSSRRESQASPSTPLRAASLVQLLGRSTRDVPIGATVAAASDRHQPAPLTGTYESTRKRRKQSDCHTWTQEEKEALRAIGDKHTRLGTVQRQKAIYKDFCARFPGTKLRSHVVLVYYHAMLRRSGNRQVPSETSGASRAIRGTLSATSTSSRSGDQARGPFTSQEAVEAPRARCSEHRTPPRQPPPGAKSRGRPFTEEEMAVLKLIRPKSYASASSRWDISADAYRVFVEKFPNTSRSESSVRHKYLKMLEARGSDAETRDKDDQREDGGDKEAESGDVELGDETGHDQSQLADTSATAYGRRPLPQPGCTPNRFSFNADSSTQGPPPSHGNLLPGRIEPQPHHVVTGISAPLTRPSFQLPDSSPAPAPGQSAGADSITCAIDIEPNRITLRGCSPGLGVGIYSPTSIRLLGRKEMVDVAQRPAREQPAFAFRIGEDQTRSVQLVKWPPGTSSSMSILPGGAADGVQEGDRPKMSIQTSVVGPDGFTLVEVGVLSWQSGSGVTATSGPKAIARPERRGQSGGPADRHAGGELSETSEPATPHSTGSQDGELPQTSFSDPLILSPLWSSSPPSAVTSLSDSGPLAPLRGGELTAFKAPLKLSLDQQPPLKQPFPSYSTDSLSPCRLDSGFKEVSAHIASASHPELAQESSLQRHQRSASHEPIADASARRSTEAEERDDTPAGSLFSGDDSDLTDEEDPDATDDASAALTDEGHRPRNSQSAKWPLAEGAFEWDKAQNDLLLSSVKKHGRNWIAVAADMAAAGAPKRTGNALKARYNRMCAAVKRNAPAGQVTPLRTASLPQLTGTSTRITLGSSALASSSRDQPIPLTGPLPGPRKRRRLEQHSWTEKEKDALRRIADKHAQLPYKAKETAFFKDFAALFPTTAKKLSPRFVFNYYNDSLRTPVGSRPLISGTSESNSGQAASTSQQRALPAEEPEPHGNGFKFTNEELAFLRTIRPKSEGVPKSRWSLGSGVHRAFKERFPDSTRSDASVRTKYLQLMDQGQLLGGSERVEDSQASRRKNVTGPGLTEQQARALLAKQPTAGQNISLGTTKASDVNDRQKGVVNNDKPMSSTTLLSRQGILGATVGTAGAPSSPIQRPVHSSQGSSSSINFSINVEDQVITLSNCPPGLGVAVYSPTSIRLLGRQQMLDLSSALEQPAFAFRISEDESRSVQLVNWPQGTSTSMAIVSGNSAAEGGKAGPSSIKMDAQPRKRRIVLKSGGGILSSAIRVPATPPQGGALLGPHSSPLFRTPPLPPRKRNAGSQKSQQDDITSARLLSGLALTPAHPKEPSAQHSASLPFDDRHFHGADNGSAVSLYDDYHESDSCSDDLSEPVSSHDEDFDPTNPDKEPNYARVAHRHSHASGLAIPATTLSGTIESFEWDKIQNDYLLSMASKLNNDWLAVGKEMEAKGWPQRSEGALRRKWQRLMRKSLIDEAEQLDSSATGINELCAGAKRTAVSRRKIILTTGRINKKKHPNHSWTEEERKTLRQIGNKHDRLGTQGKEKAIFKDFKEVFPTTQLSPHAEFSYYCSMLRYAKSSEVVNDRETMARLGDRVLSTSPPPQQQGHHQSRTIIPPRDSKGPHRGIPWTQEEIGILDGIKPPLGEAITRSAVFKAFKISLPQTKRTESSVIHKWQALFGKQTRRLTRGGGKIHGVKEEGLGPPASSSSLQQVKNEPDEDQHIVNRSIQSESGGSHDIGSSSQNLNKRLDFALQLDTYGISLQNPSAGLAVAIYSPTLVRFLGFEQMHALSQAEDEEQPAFAFQVSKGGDGSVQLINWPMGTSTSVEMVSNDARRVKRQIMATATDGVPGNKRRHTLEPIIISDDDEPAEGRSRPPRFSSPPRQRLMHQTGDAQSNLTDVKNGDLNSSQLPNLPDALAIKASPALQALTRQPSAAQQGPSSPHGSVLHVHPTPSSLSRVATLAASTGSHSPISGRIHSASADREASPTSSLSDLFDLSSDSDSNYGESDGHVKDRRPQWPEHESKLLLSCYARHPNRWTAIAREMETAGSPQRSTSALRRKYQRLMRRKAALARKAIFASSTNPAANKNQSRSNPGPSITQQQLPNTSGTTASTACAKSGSSSSSRNPQTPQRLVGRPRSDPNQETHAWSESEKAALVLIGTMHDKAGTENKGQAVFDDFARAFPRTASTMSKANVTSMLRHLKMQGYRGRLGGEVEQQLQQQSSGSAAMAEPMAEASTASSSSTALPEMSRARAVAITPASTMGSHKSPSSHDYPPRVFRRWTQSETQVLQSIAHKRASTGLDATANGVGWYAQAEVYADFKRSFPDTPRTDKSVVWKYLQLAQNGKARRVSHIEHGSGSDAEESQEESSEEDEDSQPETAEQSLAPEPTPALTQASTPLVPRASANNLIAVCNLAVEFETNGITFTNCPAQMGIAIHSQTLFTLLDPQQMDALQMTLSSSSSSAPAFAFRLLDGGSVQLLQWPEGTSTSISFVQRANEGNKPRSAMQTSIVGPDGFTIRVITWLLSGIGGSHGKMASPKMPGDEDDSGIALVPTLGHDHGLVESTLLPAQGEAQHPQAKTCCSTGEQGQPSPLDLQNTISLADASAANSFHTALFQPGVRAAGKPSLAHASGKYTPSQWHPMPGSRGSSAHDSADAALERHQTGKPTSCEDPTTSNSSALSSPDELAISSAAGSVAESSVCVPIRLPRWKKSEAELLLSCAARHPDDWTAIGREMQANGSPPRTESALRIKWRRLLDTERECRAFCGQASSSAIPLQSQDNGAQPSASAQLAPSTYQTATPSTSSGFGLVTTPVSSSATRQKSTHARVIAKHRWTDDEKRILLKIGQRHEALGTVGKIRLIYDEFSRCFPSTTADMNQRTVYTMYYGLKNGTHKIAEESGSHAQQSTSSTSSTHSVPTSVSHQHSAAAARARGEATVRSQPWEEHELLALEEIADEYEAEGSEEWNRVGHVYGRFVRIVGPTQRSEASVRTKFIRLFCVSGDEDEEDEEEEEEAYKPRAPRRSKTSQLDVIDDRADASHSNTVTYKRGSDAALATSAPFKEQQDKSGLVIDATTARDIETAPREMIAPAHSNDTTLNIAFDLQPNGITFERLTYGLGIALYSPTRFHLLDKKQMQGIAGAAAGLELPAFAFSMQKNGSIELLSWPEGTSTRVEAVGGSGHKVGMQTEIIGPDGFTVRVVAWP